MGQNRRHMKSAIEFKDLDVSRNNSFVGFGSLENKSEVTFA